MKRPYIPQGIDQQGRNTDDLACAEGIIRWVIAVLAMWAIVLLTFTFMG